jgi:hypothetical protein
LAFTLDFLSWTVVAFLGTLATQDSSVRTEENPPKIALIVPEKTISP